MEEVKKRKIVLASVLKPVDDTRMVEKLAQSFAEMQQFEINIIGYPTNRPPRYPFTTYALKRFSRVSFRRWIASLRIFVRVLSLRPHLYLVTTHELLAGAALIKLITGCKLIYDVQENYYANILHTEAFPSLMRRAVAAYVRMIEKITAPFIDHFFLAEKSYTEELKFIGNRFTILENKIRIPHLGKTPKREKYKLLFSGTLAETTGVFKAIEIASLLHSLEPRITLTVIGYAAQQTVLEKIRRLAAQLPYVELIGGDELVPHERILQEIQQSGAGIIAYPENPSTRSSVPTKLYEYLGYRLPIILTNHPHWTQFCGSLHAAIVFDPAHLDARQILNALTSGEFYTAVPDNIYWETEHVHLVNVVNRLFKR